MDERTNGMEMNKVCLKSARPSPNKQSLMKLHCAALRLLPGIVFFQSLVATTMLGFPSAEEVLRQSIEARGGREAALNIQSFQAKGVVLFYTESVPYGPAITNAWPMEISAMRPDKIRFAADFNATLDASFVFLPPRYLANGVNGRTAWEAPPGQRPQALDGIFLEERREQAELFAWCADSENYRSLTNLGESSFEGQRCYELRLVRKSGNIETHYYNTNNCVLAGIVRSSVFGPSLERFAFSDYRKSGGFQFPTRISYQAEDERDTAHLRSVEQLTSVEVNQVKTSVFEMPRETIPPPRQKEPRPRTITDAEIKTMLRDWIDSDKVADGIVVGLLNEQGRRVISRGKVDGTNASGDTVFGIASITKVFTRLLLLDMVQRGEMRLDDPAQEYLPASLRLPARHGKQITLLHLATHTSGLPRWVGTNASPVELVYAALSGYEPSRDPGADYEYSNIGMDLLGKAIERKAGKSYQSLVVERICQPLGMNHTSVRPHAFEAFEGAGGVSSTANDLLKFASACLGFASSPLSPLLRHEFASHGGGSTEYLVLDPVRRRAVVTLADSQSSRYYLARMMLNHLILNQSPKPPGTANMDGKICGRYAGQYLSDNNSTWIMRREGNRLLLQEPCAPSCEVFPQSETTFLSEMRGLGATFVPETPSRATQLLLHDMTMNWDWRGVRISAHAPVPGVAFQLDARPADDCTGQYKSADGHVLIIRRNGREFTVETPGETPADQDWDELVPESEISCASADGASALTFLQDSSGKIASVVRHVDASHIRYAKFAPVPAGAAEIDSGRFIGMWEGAFVINEQTKIQMVIKIAKRNGSCQASFDLPAQGVKDMPFETLVFVSPSSLFLAVPAEDGRATFRATLNDAATEMSGTWKEGQGSFAVTFKRTTGQPRGTGKIN
jgi:CubicO group peptidase (beta-lactamase class C family)